MLVYVARITSSTTQFKELAQSEWNNHRLIHGMKRATSGSIYCHHHWMGRPRPTVGQRRKSLRSAIRLRLGRCTLGEPPIARPDEQKQGHVLPALGRILRTQPHPGQRVRSLTIWGSITRQARRRLQDGFKFQPDRRTGSTLFN